MTRGPENINRLEAFATKVERIKPTKPFEDYEAAAVIDSTNVTKPEERAGNTKLQEARNKAGSLIRRGRNLIPIGHKETRINQRQAFERDTQIDAEQYLEEQEIEDPDETYDVVYEALRDSAYQLPVDNLLALPDPLLQRLINGYTLSPNQMEELSQIRDNVELTPGGNLPLGFPTRRIAPSEDTVRRIPYSVAAEIDRLDLPPFLRSARQVDDPPEPEEYYDYIDEQRLGLQHVINRLYNIRDDNRVEKASIKDYLTEYRGLKNNPIERTDIEEAKNVISRALCVARVSPDAHFLEQLQSVLPAEDYEAIHQEFLNYIRLTIDRHQLPRSIGKTFPEDAEWLNQWDEYFQEAN